MSEHQNPLANALRAIQNENVELRSQLANKDHASAALRHALECCKIAMTGVGIPHPKERELLQDAMNEANKALSSTSNRDYVRREVLEKCVEALEVMMTYHGIMSHPGILLSDRALTQAREELKKKTP